MGNGERNLESLIRGSKENSKIARKLLQVFEDRSTDTKIETFLMLQAFGSMGFPYFDEGGSRARSLGLSSSYLRFAKKLGVIKKVSPGTTISYSEGASIADVRGMARNGTLYVVLPWAHGLAKAIFLGYHGIKDIGRLRNDLERIYGTR